MTLARRRVQEYYERMTPGYMAYGGAALGWHLGLWDEGTADTQAALRRNNEVLLEGCELGPDRRVLDAGCGVGGLVQHIALRTRAQVTGITLSPRHVAMARALAEARGLAARVAFQSVDFQALPFADASFDLVVQQESFCYALDRETTLAGMYRVLAPGGCWRAADAFLAGAVLDPEQEGWHRAAQHGWKIPPLARPGQVCDLLRAAGFLEVTYRDLCAATLPSLRALMAQSEALEARGLDPEDRLSRRDWECMRDHMRASAAFARGLLAGAFGYGILSARRPPAP